MFEQVDSIWEICLLHIDWTFIERKIRFWGTIQTNICDESQRELEISRIPLKWKVDFCFTFSSFLGKIFNTFSYFLDKIFNTFLSCPDLIPFSSVQ